MILLAEDLLLLLLDDETGKYSGRVSADDAVGGALLAELDLAGLVRVTETGHRGRAEQVMGVPGETPVDPLLARAHEIAVESPRRPASIVWALGEGGEDHITERLSQRGIVERREHKTLGLIPRTRWPAVDSAHEDAVRRDVDAALRAETPPSPRVAALIAVTQIVSLGPLTDGIPTLRERRAIVRRAEDIGRATWVAGAVGDVIRTTNG